MFSASLSVKWDQDEQVQGWSGEVRFTLGRSCRKNKSTEIRPGGNFEEGNPAVQKRVFFEIFEIYLPTSPQKSLSIAFLLTNFEKISKKVLKNVLRRRDNFGELFWRFL